MKKEDIKKKLQNYFNNGIKEGYQAKKITRNEF